MATPYLVITDGTTTCTINTSGGGVGDYALEEWTPAVAGLRKSALAGRGPYEEVVEEMTITIIDTTAAGCYTRLDTINVLLDQAERWADGESETAVLIKYSPGGAGVSSSGTPLQAAILGPAPGNTTSGVGIRVIQKAQFTFHLPVTLRFWRRGQWLLSESSASSSATTNGAIATVDLTAALGNIGPTKLTMSDYVTMGSEKGILLISSNDTVTRLTVENPTGATATGWTAVDDSANYAKYTNVLRYTPSATTESTSGSFNLSPSGGPLFAVYACIRNNSNSTSFSVRARVAGGGGTKAAYTPYRYIAPYSSAAQPAWYLLGIVPFATGTMKFLATASAASGTIDFGAVAILDVSYRSSYALTFGPSEVNGTTKEMIIDHQLLSQPQATGSGSDPFDVKGDMVIETIARNIAIVSLICGASNDWRQYDAIGAAVVQNTWTLDRYSAYLTPR